MKKKITRRKNGRGVKGPCSPKRSMTNDPEQGWDMTMFKTDRLGVADTSTRVLTQRVKSHTFAYLAPSFHALFCLALLALP